MKKYKKIIFILILASIVTYILHYIIFRDFHHIAVFFLEDLAFIPIEVIVVTLIIHRVIENAEKEKKMNKLYMVIEIFFSEVGIDLLTILSTSDNNLEKIRKNLIINDTWSDNEFIILKKSVSAYIPNIVSSELDLNKLKELLINQRNFMLGLLENPMILEHETFTELLMAVFHLEEELKFREDVTKLKPKDLEHIIKDIERVYVLLAYEWIDYMHHMKTNYPYLFNFAKRINPFNTEIDMEVK